MATTQKPIDILLVEDNPADVRLTRLALKDASPNTLHVARDGAEALRMLLGDGGRPPLRPDVILLDLNLPRKDGREVLAEIKQREELMRIPVIVLTTSQSEEDVRRSYKLHANAFVTKPLNLSEFFEAMRAIDSFWLGMATLPSEE